MKRFQGRCAADSLSVMQCHGLQSDLQTWIDSSQQQATVLWRLGMYGEVHVDRDVLKMAPNIQDLLMNRSLWKLLLAYFPTGRFKDRYLADIVHRLLEHSKKINHTKMEDPMLVTWLCKSVHNSMSHIRSLAIYTDRFSYRINKLSSEEQKKREQLQELLDLVASEEIKAARAKRLTSEPNGADVHEPSPSESSRRTSMASPTSVLRPHVPRPSSKPPEEDLQAAVAGPHGQGEPGATVGVARARIASVLAAFSASPERGQKRRRTTGRQLKPKIAHPLPSLTHKIKIDF